MDNPKALITTNANTSLVVQAKRLIKQTKLDRKSSRGMIYENEELRLRTININAEVERGQSDIKRLKKENELLRREIWTLRDECDRLHKKVKAKFMAHDQAICSVRCKHAESMAGEYQCRCLMADGVDSSFYCHPVHQQAVCNNAEKTDFYSLDCYCGMETDDEHNQIVDGGQNVKAANNNFTEYNGSLAEQLIGKIPSSSKANEINGAAVTNVSLSDAFDNLSTVTEENANDQDNDSASKSSKLPSLLGRITPLTSIELVANELKDLQSLTPPLSYFESILNQHMNSTNESNYNSAGKIVSSSAETLTCNSINCDPNQQSKIGIRTSTTTTPTNDVIDLNSSPIPAYKESENSIAKEDRSTLRHLLELEKSSPSEISTLAAASSALNKVENYRKHFFAPLKPKLKSSISLGNRRIATTASSSSSPMIVEEMSLRQNHGPPDLWVLNALPSISHQTIRTPPAAETNTLENNSSFTEELETDKLQSLLNDIESISEDIQSLQLQKNKSHEELSRTKEILECKGENLKPFKSEMNLLLTYDKSQKPKFQLNKELCDLSPKPFTSKHPITNTSDLRRTQSLDRRDTDSPSPNIPDPMMPFPDNRSYMDFQHLNKDPFDIKISNGATNGIDSNLSQKFTSTLLPRTLYNPSTDMKTDNHTNIVEVSEQVNNTQGDPTSDKDGNSINDVDKVEDNPFADNHLMPSTSANETTQQTGSLYTKPNVILNNPRNSLKTETTMDAITSKTISNLKIISVNEQLQSNNTYVNGNQIAVNEGIPSTSFVTPMKCLRRHSESTVQHMNHCTNAIIANSPFYHHSHLHHQHQHSHPHQYQHQHQHQHNQDHCNRQENHPETNNTTPSEENSSSRSSDKSHDSLSSSSPRLQRRKLSISSQHGGKIPWFGCWGNGCL